MNTRIPFQIIQRTALLLLFLTLNSQLSPTFAQSTAFTYQGRFNTNGTPFTGAAEFQFTVWDALSGGSAVATNNPASVATVADERDRICARPKPHRHRRVVAGGFSLFH